jgi:radical SAM superfamily enzyme YgiQ (UPF0313 family)
MKIDIVIVYVPRYRMGHERNFVPPLTGIHLAALTPPEHEVRVIHQQVEPVDLDTDADLIALSFFSGFAAEAYRLADAFRQRGKVVVAGGPHATFSPEETLTHCDAVVTGEAESVWAEMLADAARGQLKSQYQGKPQPLAGLPTPRYDLLPKSFFIPRVVQATRGCPFTCSFCSVPELNPGFRARPVEEVLRDLRYEAFDRPWQRKVVWFWDDNLTADRRYVTELLEAMVPLKRWWLTQASMDIARDPALLDLMAASGCIGVFFGIETFGAESLKAAHKPQNQIARYREAIMALHQRGIAVMAGFVAGFDGDTPESIVAMADHLYDVGVDVPFISILTPYRGTPLHETYDREGRLLPDLDADHYNGYNVAFTPHRMSPEALLQAHRALWRRAFAPRAVAQRMARAARYLRPGALLMATAMNGFYGLKRLRGNLPRCAGAKDLEHTPLQDLPRERVPIRL